MAMIVLFIILPFIDFSPVLLTAKKNFILTAPECTFKVFCEIGFVKNFISIVLHIVHFLSFFYEPGFAEASQNINRTV